MNNRQEHKEQIIAQAKNDFVGLINGKRGPRWFFSFLCLLCAGYILYLIKYPAEVSTLYFFGLKGSIILLLLIIALFLYFIVALINWIKWFRSNKINR